MFWIWTLFFALSGCMANQSLSTEAMSESNISNLSRVSVGMSESQVLRIMHHPYSQESFEHNGDTYDIWFYVTRVTGLDQSRLVPQNLTPLTFRNGRLIGWGYAYYNYLLRQDEIQTQLQRTSLQPEEENGIEKVLESPQTVPSQQYPEKIIPLQAPPPFPQPPQQTPPPLSPPPPPEPSVSPRGPQQPSPPAQPKPPTQPKSPTQQPQKQPEPQQPPPPVQPPVQAPSPSLSKRGEPLAMCSRPVSPPKATRQEEEASTPDEEQEPYLDEEGDKMIEEENEQNFDFW